MSLPNRIGAYNDCFEVFEKALASGLRCEFASHPEAAMFMMRLHQARSLQRDEHKRIYERNDPRWGASEYDKLIVRSPREDGAGHWWVYLELAGSNILSFEPLGDHGSPELNEDAKKLLAMGQDPGLTLDQI